jgi:Tol biopolymer transport system component
MNKRVFYWVIGLWIIGALFVPILLVSTTQAQTKPPPQLTVLVEALNVREGPGITYPVVGILNRNFEVPITGRDPVSGWWQITLPDGREVWVTNISSYVQVDGDTTAVLDVTPATTPLVQPIPIVSPDTGGNIVFQISSGGPIYAINADGSNLRYLTTGLDPAISPDGQWVAFARWDSPGFGGLGSVWVIGVDGTGERPLLGGIEAHPKSPTWSPDGQRIAFSMQLAGGHPTDVRECSEHSVPPIAFDVAWVATEDGGKLCYTLPPESFWGLRVVDVATGEYRDLPHDTHAFSPTWDPAVPWRLVYAAERGLVSLDINQGTAVPLTEDVLDHSPVFSPDGQKIAVTYLQHDHWDIHVMNADGTARVRLTETPLINIIEQRLQGEEPRNWNNAAATWSPDGSQIAFLTDRNGTWEIFVMNADGSNPRPLFASGTLVGIDLQYHGVDERVISWGP